MEMYGEDGTIEVGSNVLLDLKDNEDLIQLGISKFLRRLYTTCDARKLIVWRVNDGVSAVWSMTGSMTYPANENAYSVMIGQAQRMDVNTPPPIPCGAVMLINNTERMCIEEQAYKIVKHTADRVGLDIAMVDMGAVQ